MRSAGNRLLELALQRIQQKARLFHLGPEACPEPNLDLSLQRLTMGTGMSAATRGQRRPTASLCSTLILSESPWAQG